MEISQLQYEEPFVLLRCMTGVVDQDLLVPIRVDCLLYHHSLLHVTARLLSSGSSVRIVAQAPSKLHETAW